jgi:hypothetical protein
MRANGRVSPPRIRRESTLGDPPISPTTSASASSRGPYRSQEPAESEVIPDGKCARTASTSTVMSFTLPGLPGGT